MNLRSLSGRRISDSENEIRFNHCNLYFYGTKMDMYGNSCFVFGFPNSRKFSIQTGYNYDFTLGNADKFAKKEIQSSRSYGAFKDMDDMESFFVTLIQRNGSSKQRSQLKLYNGYTPSAETYKRIYSIRDSRRIKDGMSNYDEYQYNQTRGKYYYKIYAQLDDGYHSPKREGGYSNSIEECKRQAMRIAEQMFDEYKIAESYESYIECSIMETKSGVTVDSFDMWYSNGDKRVGDWYHEYYEPIYHQSSGDFLLSDSRRVSDATSKGIKLPNTNLWFYGTKWDINGNTVAVFSFDKNGGRKWSVQVNAYDAFRGLHLPSNNTPVDIINANSKESVENAVVKYINEFGTKMQKDGLFVEPNYVSDSRRVKDAHQYSYGGTDRGGHYDEDFEMADEEHETAVDLMNGYMRLEEKNGIDWNRNIPMETWKNLFYDAMEMGLKADITDPNYIYDELEDANFHHLNWCLCISGVLGTDFQNEAIDYFTKVFANKKKGMRNDYSYSVSDIRNQALWQIMQEMELV